MEMVRRKPTKAKGVDKPTKEIEERGTKWVQERVLLYKLAGGAEAKN